MGAVRSIVPALVLVAFAGAASAQTAENVLVSVNAGIVQPASTSFTSDATKQVYAETGLLHTSDDLSLGTTIDGGILLRIAGGFGAGVAVSRTTQTGTADITGSIPHPFFFGTLRPLSGAASGVNRTEVATHIQAAYLVRRGRLALAVSGGPTIFIVDQTLVSDVTLAETYPYDTVALASATLTRSRASAVGFNAGEDIGVSLSKWFGVGGLVRYSRATVTVPLAGSAGVKVHAGGLQVAGGLRFFF